MRISFDLDGTLICPGDTSLEPNRVPWLLRLWFRERLRVGTVALMTELRRRGWEIAIYTTSQRSCRYVRWWFRFYGIRVAAIVNQPRHARQVGDRASKLPSAFGIDLHVDDSDGVAQEGRQHGFAVVVVRPGDPTWADKVLSAARSFEGGMHSAGEPLARQSR